MEENTKQRWAEQHKGAVHASKKYDCFDILEGFSWHLFPAALPLPPSLCENCPLLVCSLRVYTEKLYVRTFCFNNLINVVV